MKHITLLLFTAVIVLCRALPTAESGGDSGVVTLNNPFDLGPVTECRRPSTNLCSIDYDVPASIAALTDIIEYDIQGRLMSRLFEEPTNRCVIGLKEALCAFRFPRCDGINVVMNSTPNCTQKISSCGRGAKRVIEAEGLCQLQATVPLDSCAPLSESQIQFRRCSSSVVDGSARVTEWMLQYMNLTDREWDLKLDETQGLSTLWERAACTDNLLRYNCEFYGQCTDNDRIEIIRNTEGFCNDMISCYADGTADSLRYNINCELWPTQSVQPSASTSTNSVNSRPISRLPSWPSPPTIGSGVVLHPLTGTLLISFVLALFLSR